MSSLVCDIEPVGSAAECHEGGREHDTTFYKKRYGGITDKPHSTMREIGEYIAAAYPDKNVFCDLFEHDVSVRHPIMENLSEVEGTLEYFSGSSTNKANNLHNGQRKLLLSEIQFLTAIANKNVEFCLYAGAAPSHKGKLLVDLFPSITFIFVDPNPFSLFLYGNDLIEQSKSSYREKRTPVSHRDVYHKDIIHLTYSSALPRPKGNVYEKNGRSNMHISEWGDTLAPFIAKKEYRVYIIEDIMTCGISEQLKPLAESMAFITDARTNIDSGSPTDLDIVWNTSMMFNWIKVLDPVASCFKYRPPYGNGMEHFKENYNKGGFRDADFKMSKEFGIDFISNYLNGKWEFLKGETMIQVWAPSGSTETRHWTMRGAPIAEDPAKLYDDKCNYFKSILRGKVYHDNPHADLSIGLGYCNDCGLECRIWSDYIATAKEKGYYLMSTVVREYVRMTDMLLNRPLLSTHNCGIRGFPVTVKMMYECILWYEAHLKDGKAVHKFNESKKLYTEGSYEVKQVESDNVSFQDRHRGFQGNGFQGRHGGFQGRHGGFGGRHDDFRGGDTARKPKSKRVMVITHTKDMKNPKEATDSGKGVLPIPLPEEEGLCMVGAGSDGLCAVGKAAAVLKKEISAVPGCDGVVNAGEVGGSGSVSGANPTMDTPSCIEATFTECKDEACAIVSLVDQKKLTPDEAKEGIVNFKPNGPSYTDDLLSNYNIDDVLAKLVSIMSSESPYHMPFQMVDFQGVPDGKGGWKRVNGVLMEPTELGTINLFTDVMSRGYKTFFVVMNTDHRYNGGEHWFPIFADFRGRCTLEYFNSSGNVPRAEVSAWLIKQHRILTDAGCNPVIVQLSGIVHQLTSETECGVYSLYYIICRLKKVSTDIINSRRIPDEYMLTFRRHLFNQSKWLDIIAKESYRPFYRGSKGRVAPRGYATR